LSVRVPAEVVYDSAHSRRTAPAILHELASQRWLFRVLLRRDLILRYKRSALGVFWSLLNPLLMSAVFFVIFSNLFRFRTGGTPYIVYVLSGTVLMTLFSTAVLSAATSLVNSAPVLARIRAPATAFALAAAGAGGRSEPRKRRRAIGSTDRDRHRHRGRGTAGSRADRLPWDACRRPRARASSNGRALL
jgi:hypothetical protein